MTRIYRLLKTEEVLRLIDWADKNDVDYELWDPWSSLKGAEFTEIWMERYPDEQAPAHQQSR
jgi:hypothetical protein